MVRLMIVLLLAGSGVLGWLIYQERKELETLTAALDKQGDVPTLAREIQELAQLYNAYKQRGLSEGVKGDDPQPYVYEMAGKDKVNIGRVNVRPETPREYVRGTVDRTYSIKPNDRNATFHRANIANFLYSLEANSRRIKVTRVVLNAPGRIAHEELPPDEWTMDVSVTLRERKQDG